ncbi:type I restriction-modification system DNA methylase subunit [Paraburkholderia sp. HC6.4b]|uniref:N-6 DNA methylase n=1 Tax=unclassified Paraburkholderia TaxID=2615204 RepID=UPI001609814E|nr:MULTISPECIES: N-6 DNA methylase [unclassified Paraburkholderia]MBB5409243.1 type I restriction-modification system DNA methylase subunit [Paraburkholderia sp. HC6.4b]MBB5450971.1 type I restriction-modification system DNA methylase subunit [Paraburkholderia sp. Kb1A]
MGRRDKNQFSIKVNPHQHNIVELMRGLFARHNPYSVFTDFIETSAIALSNRFDFAQRDRREKRYMEIVKGYTSDEATKFAHMFVELLLCYRERTDEFGSPGLGHSAIDRDGDVLGKIFSMLDVGNDRLGQFFTPGGVQSLMALMTLRNEDEVRDQIREHGFITVLEPACGAGGMVVALAETFHNLGFNYPTQFHATCVDKDRLCVHMTYLQLSLRGIPAIIVQGDSLTLQTWDTWYTPTHIFLGWNARLQKRRESEKQADQQAAKLLQPAAEPRLVKTPSAMNLDPGKLVPTPN